jgi:hypothetical protein
MLRRFRAHANKLAREITITLLLKILLIIGIWYLFFSHPVDDTLTEEKVRQQILGAPFPGAHPSSSSLITDNHYHRFEGVHAWSPKV